MTIASDHPYQRPARAVAIDVFLIGGQSNAVGAGDAALSPVPPPGKVLQCHNGTIYDARDPVGIAQTGSAWPSFGIAYYQATGRMIAFVPAAVGGSCQAALCEVGDTAGNWDFSGTHYGASVAKLDAALVALRDRGYAPDVKGVLWSQGENDGGAIAFQQVPATPEIYKDALKAMIARYRARYCPRLPFYIFKTGTYVPSAELPGWIDTRGWALVRAAQEQVAADDPYTHVVFSAACEFPDRGLMSSTLHYNQAGYNEMGTIGAQNVLAAMSVAACAV